ncbi:MAG: sulfatase-like hydrolase/transferase [candidate division Zixibacteria bacterium]|nr:sulfatase-like hydrolase/transferase [candidate division Zixibacteria bacterium]
MRTFIVKDAGWSKYLSTSAVYFLLLTITLTLFFELWRLILLILSGTLSAGVPGRILLQSFLVGLRFDFAISCYLAIPLYLLGNLPRLDISRNKFFRHLNFYLMALVVGLMFFLQMADIEFFKFFNSRLNSIALAWSDTPGIVVPMLWKMYPVVRYLVLFLVMFTGFIIIIHWLREKIIIDKAPSPVWINLVYLPLVLAVFLLGARGRVEEKSPLRWGTAYFSEYDYANQLALNPIFTFFYDAIYDANKKAQIKEQMDRIDIPDAVRVVRHLLGLPVALEEENNQRIFREITFTPENDDPPNVILIIMESFGSTRIGILDNRYPYEITPRFDSLSREGILFTNFYSTGQHTYTGIFSTLYGYPTLFGKSVMKMVTGQNSFWGLPSILRHHGYETMFFTTHDPHFDNMQGFLCSNGVMRLYSLDDYNPEYKISTLGVPDHIMFDYAYNILREKNEHRFFATLLTSSNHGPWLIPDVPFERIPAEDEEWRTKLNCFKYSDWSLGYFFDKIKNDPAFKNTLVVVTSDNGCWYDPITDHDLTQFQIPLFIFDTDGRLEKNRRVERLGSQIDIAATVMGQVRLNYHDYTFGHDLLKTSGSAVDYAHFSEWYKVGYIENDYHVIARLNGPTSLYTVANRRRNLVDSLPDLAREYEKKALALFKTAYENMHRPLRQETSSPQPLTVSDD